MIAYALYARLDRLPLAISNLRPLDLTYGLKDKQIFHHLLYAATSLSLPRQSYPPYPEGAVPKPLFWYTRA